MSSFPKELCIPMRSPLNDMDNINQTYGCRHSNPDICRYCYLDGICAFCNEDKMCRHPSAMWEKIYKELKET